MTTISHSTTKPDDGLWVLFAVCLAALMLPLSFSGGAIATPAIGRALGGSAASLTWITNAFMLTFGSLLMAAGALADRFGRKRVFAGGIILFVVFSLASSFGQGGDEGRHCGKVVDAGRDIANQHLELSQCI